uniref:Uncharacterized protein n=1 Tax=Chromera velia CCMP2878 TaxID=1169474 RepID=A0A0G4FLC5_9ALVE|eukprot:Cvel_17625.t1-p1 / transcript=Cvel_17625.t1 / gene=Cvel_17625 / organism=Chromera_velia_CCMP2878 / gene_product=hypothetical protein / transcript_product=hypothetical protein / location=Cvel_scaffold1418:34588-35590(+) / protein_length=171 / sequence_SO=supercontig / SO=protein_coding / is_pseudo=false
MDLTQIGEARMRERERLIKQCEDLRNRDILDEGYKKELEHRKIQVAPCKLEFGVSFGTPPASDQGCGTTMIDFSSEMGLPYPATSPSLLASFLRITKKDETIETNARATFRPSTSSGALESRVQSMGSWSGVSGTSSHFLRVTRRWSIRAQETPLCPSTLCTTSPCLSTSA